MMRCGARLGWFSVAFVACLVAGFAAELPAEKPNPKPAGDRAAKALTVIYPPDKAVVPSGDFDIICRGDAATLRADGELIPWESFEPPLKVAHVCLYCGPNTIEIGNRRVEVFVAETAAEPGGPKAWPMVRRHPISGSGEERCADCHRVEARGDGVAVGELAGHNACFECHKAVEFEAIHSHPLKPIEHCQMCHGLHGSTEKKLLKAPMKTLCTECHES